MRQRSGWEGATDQFWDAPVGAGEYDALADLFLGPEPGAPAPSPANGTNGVGRKPEPAPPLRLAQTHTEPTPPTPANHDPTLGAATGRVVEALVLGHLPAMSGAWATQHARASAERDGRPVALVRLTGGLASIELVGAPLDAATVAAPTLEEAIGAAAVRAGRFLLRVESTEEPGLCATAGVGSVTLLTGADEPAIVAAYRTIKAIAGAFEPSADGAPEGTRPALRVVFMGSAAEDAQAGSTKLAAAAHAFLGECLEFEHGAERLGPTTSVSLYRGRSNAPTRAVVNAVIAAARAAGPLPPAVTREPPAPVPLTPQSIPPIPEREVEPKAAAPTATNAALALLAPGLRPTPLTSPDAQGVEFALDAEGCLHALCEGAPDAAGRLLAARAWATRHAPLIALALKGADLGPFDAAAPVRMCVLTREPASAAALRHTEIRVRAIIGAASVPVS